VLGAVAPGPVAVDDVAEALRASLPVELADDIEAVLWTKLVRNTMINAVSATSGLPLGRLVEDDERRRRAVTLGAEAVRVALARGIDLHDEDLFGGDRAHYLDEPGDPGFAAVEEAFRAAYVPFPDLAPSMLQDVRNGRRTEIDHMNGYVVAQGARVGVPTPANEEVVAMVHALEGRPVEGAA
jgi:2-dehydropantoate 2-reductase